MIRPPRAFNSEPTSSHLPESPHSSGEIYEALQHAEIAYYTPRNDAILDTIKVYLVFLSRKVVIPASDRDF